MSYHDVFGQINDLGGQGTFSDYFLKKYKYKDSINYQRKRLTLDCVEDADHGGCMQLWVMSYLGAQQDCLADRQRLRSPFAFCFPDHKTLQSVRRTRIDRRGLVRAAQRASLPVLSQLEMSWRTAIDRTLFIHPAKGE
jgi:hypothetical protein